MQNNLSNYVVFNKLIEKAADRIDLSEQTAPYKNALSRQTVSEQFSIN
ncbi:MAG: hypothetical protein J1E85_06485 [Ruminococcus sp.]|nr:hypothetical protein [Ruminococcus sp.]